MSDPTGPGVRECHRCGHPLRNARTPLAAAPGTRAHAAHGLCRTCYYRRTPDGATNPAHTPGEWATEGLCNQADPEEWFPTQGKNADKAIAICNKCPVLQECRNHSIRVREPFGVWGGLTEDQRWVAIASIDQKKAAS